MGVEYIGACHTCEEYIDAHKCRGAIGLINHAQGTESSARFSEFAEWATLGYWPIRLVWFMLRHGKHDTVVEADVGDAYWELIGKYKEVCSPEEMEAQRNRVSKE